MCLVTRNESPSIAEADIVCYKHLCYMTDSSQYKSPYQRTVYDVPSTVTDTVKELILKKHFASGTSVHEVYSGYIHCYKNLQDAKDNVDWSIKHAKMPRCEDVIVECVIPKGTKYWEGIWEICAKTIRLERVVK